MATLLIGLPKKKSPWVGQFLDFGGTVYCQGRYEWEI
jgi:hypothetical protein